MGRFLQPNLTDGSYNMADPQSLNRYSYVQNDPVNFVDPSGLDLSGCSAEFSYSQCGGDGGFWGGGFGNGVAIFNDIFGDMPEHSRGFYAGHLMSVNPGTFARFLPPGAHYLGNFNWGYSWQKSEDTWVVETITFTYERLRSIVFDGFHGFGWSSGGLFRDVYGGLSEPGIDMHPVVDPVTIAAAGLAGALRGGLRAAAEGAASQPNRFYSARELLRRAEEPGPFHNFPESFNRLIFQGERTVINSRYILYTRPGSINGTRGVFEIGVRPSVSGRTEVIVHRFFRPTR